MNKILTITTALFILFSLCSCSKDKSNISMPNTASADIAMTTVDIEVIQQGYANLENEYNALQEKYNSTKKIYDGSIEDNITSYCDNMLTYTENISSDNIRKVKNIVTDTYYNELQSYLGHIQSTKNFEQACGLEALYYSNNSVPSDSTDIIAICKKTAIYNDDVSTETLAYKFNMKYQSDNWLINSVDLLI